MSRKNIPTRDRILNAAWYLLENGGSNVRMSDIAKHAGVSRQAVYLHFPNRAELLIATTRYIDDANRIDDRLAPSRAASLGSERLTAYIEAWGNYIPEIYGVGSALMAMGDSDEEARQAWADRMRAVREGCAAAVAAIKSDGRLQDGYTPETAADLLWTLLSVENWEQLTQKCGWSQKDYISRITELANATLVK